MTNGRSGSGPATIIGIRSQLLSTAGAEATISLAAIATSIAVNRALQPEGKGEFAAALAVANIAFSMSSFSLSKAFLYFFNAEGHRPGAVLASAFRLLPIGAAIGVSVVGCAAWFGVIRGAPLVVTCGGLVVALHGQDFLFGALRAIRLIHALNLAKVVQQLVRLLLFLSLSGALLLSVRLAMVVELGALLSGMVILAWTFFRRAELLSHTGKSDPSMWQLLRYGLWYQALSIVALLHLKLDVVMLNAWAGPEQAGYYSTAVNLADLVLRGPTILVFVASPYLAQLSDSRESLSYVARIVRLSMPAFVLGGGAMGIAASALLSMMYGDAFVGAALPLRIILPGTASLGVFMLLSSHLIVKGRFKPLLAIQTLGLATNVILNVLVIGTYGAIGAAGVCLLSYSLAALAIVSYLSVTEGLRWRDLLYPKLEELRPILYLRARRMTCWGSSDQRLLESGARRVSC